MRKEIKTLHITCDLCKQEIKDVWTGVSEQSPVGVVSIRHDIWYGGVWELKDFCKPCHSKLAAFLEANHAVGNGQKVN